MSPPSPFIIGSKTDSTAFVAIAASTALPPRFKMSKPASLAKGCADATCPLTDKTGDLEANGAPTSLLPPQLSRDGGTPGRLPQQDAKATVGSKNKIIGGGVG